jgi:hypothetical protein
MIPVDLPPTSVRELLDANRAVARYLERFLSEGLNAPSQCTQIAFATSARLHGLLEGIYVLAERQLGYEIGALARVTAEFAIVLGWIGIDESRAQMYLDSWSLQGEMMIRVMMEQGLRPPAEHLQQINKITAEIRGRRRLAPDTRERLPTLEKMACDAPRDVISEGFYDFYYRPLSISAHADPRSLRGTMSQEGVTGIGSALIFGQVSVNTCLRAIYRVIPSLDLALMQRVESTVRQAAEMAGEP